jgi:predicted amidophosphoribosyltransferase
VSGAGALLASLADAEWGNAAFDAVTFVPAGRSAAAKGFDHARALARCVATNLGVEVLPLIRRVASGPRQADVSFEERWSNVANRFEVAAGAFDATGAAGRVLLVDDVLTTGATAAACGRALKLAGATSVDVLTFARTVRRRADRGS